MSENEKDTRLFLRCCFLLMSGCGSNDSHNVISCTDVVTAYEEAGYEVWHKEYAEEERDYSCEVVAEDADGDAIYFTFFESADEAEQHAKDSQWNLLLWTYFLISGDPTWVYTETYNTIAIQYENAEMYAPFCDLK